jgi:hypothetical protein
MSGPVVVVGVVDDAHSKLASGPTTLPCELRVVPEKGRPDVW